MILTENDKVWSRRGSENVNELFEESFICAESVRLSIQIQLLRYNQKFTIFCLKVNRFRIFDKKWINFYSKSSDIS